jgi:transcriptional regulator with XRE-family HTH domain
VSEADLSTRIRRARTEAGLTREQLAVKIGVSMATLVRYETGRTKRLPLVKLDKIAQATGKPVVWFFDKEAV